MSARLPDTKLRARKREYMREYLRRTRLQGWPSIEVEQAFVDAIREIIGLDPIGVTCRSRT